jgi:tRNA threonylcarbamoyladenosine biosynthesis protein TsaB
MNTSAPLAHPAHPPPANLSAAKPLRLLALDTSTEVLSLAVSNGEQSFAFEGTGGAAASRDIIAQIFRLLKQAQLSVDDLDAVVFGQGPGSFTGLRTACSVAQGLAFGARRGVGGLVLPVPSLLAMAEQARFDWAGPASVAPVTSVTLAMPTSSAAVASATQTICVAMDARMQELYVAHYALCAPESAAAAQCIHAALAVPVRTLPPSELKITANEGLAGNAAAAYPQELSAERLGQAMHFALPTASAMLRLAPVLWRLGRACEPALALPLYVRNQVALTTAERAAVAAAKLLTA